MNFFDMGIGEILLILVVALIIWGPGKIPELGRMLGKAMSVLKKSSFDLTTQLKKELEEEKPEPRSKLDTKTSKNNGATRPAGAAEDSSIEQTDIGEK
ncbi:twin-arginine translocase TatA/TatE family subunit [Chloroflexota bacterium]